MKRRAVISVNIAVLLFGLAGLCAKWIQLPAVAISFGRVLFSSMALGIFMLVRKQRFLIDDRKDLLLLICAGAILGLHWWSFLQSVQLSTVAIGTIMFSSFPLFNPGFFFLLTGSLSGFTLIMNSSNNSFKLLVSTS